MAMTEGVLDFSYLRRINLLRCTDPRGFDHPLSRWSVAEWGNATAGEIGEACNIAKKMIRHRDALRGNVKLDDRDIRYLVNRLAHEVADAVIYADLWTASCGIDLGRAIVMSFNDKSDELDCPVKL